MREIVKQSIIGRYLPIHYFKCKSNQVEGSAGCPCLCFLSVKTEASNYVKVSHVSGVPPPPSNDQNTIFLSIVIIEKQPCLCTHDMRVLAKINIMLL